MTNTYHYAVRGYKLWWKEPSEDYKEAHEKLARLKEYHRERNLYWRVERIKDEVKPNARNKEED